MQGEHDAVKAEGKQEEVRFVVLKPGEIKMKRLLPFNLILPIIAIPLCLAAYAGEIEPNFADYLMTIGDDDFASAIVFLQDRPNIRALDASLHAEKAPLTVRHEQVFAALTQAAERSQPALLRYLDTAKDAGTVRGYTPYWITNMVVISATKAELERIADHVHMNTPNPVFLYTWLWPDHKWVFIKGRQFNIEESLIVKIFGV